MHVEKYKSMLIKGMVKMEAAKLVSIKILIMFFVLFSSNVFVAQTIVFTDNFESGTTKWNLTGVWGLSTAQYNSGLNSITESPSADYVNNHSSSATTVNSINLSSYLSAEVSFWAKYDIEYAFDYMYLELSKDGGSTFVTIDEFTGVSATWTKYTYNVGNFAGFPNVKLRFRFYSDQYVVGDGMYIDDITITASVLDNSAPLIVHSSPKFYEGTLGDFSVNAEVTDVSGVASTRLYYTVDGGSVNTVIGTNVSGNEYNYIIPEQSAGTNVSYKIEAIDNSPFFNVTDTSLAKKHKYISGKYLSYDDGIVNAVANVTGVNAVAVKISIPTGQFGFLKSALIRNYRDPNNVNDDMLFHVWANDNGMPGSDLITPFLVTPEATLDNPFPFTRIDLRSYSPELDDLQGDIFIGFTVPQNTVSIITSNSSNGRSYSFNGTSWTAVTKDYEFRAIIYESSSPLPVELTAFTATSTNSSNGSLSVNLNWETATEVNNYGFEILRSAQNDGHSEEGTDEESWEKVGFVSGHGNSNSPKYYSYKDDVSKLSGKYLYRLKQIDIDGKFDYSEIVEIKISAPNSFTLEQNYPNPFNPNTTIKYSVPLVENANVTLVQLKVYDVLGKELKTLVNENLGAGIYEAKFNASEYPSGLYFYTITVGSYSQTKKMILLK